MSRILITAFEPYGEWAENASQLVLAELEPEIAALGGITTRIYPVDFGRVRELLARDLAAGCDYALHLGQAPGASNVQLEAVGINVGGNPDQPPEEFESLVEEGPVGYRSRLPLASWAGMLRRAGVPAQVSHHAGTYLCNATLYLSHYLAEQMELQTLSTFVHLPLDSSQAGADLADVTTLPRAVSAAAIRFILSHLR